jgi:hypothetical protein
MRVGMFVCLAFSFLLNKWTTSYELNFPLICMIS